MRAHDHFDSHWMNTMYRCALAASLTLAVAALQTPAAAQTGTLRPFPQSSLRGVMVFGEPPTILLNGQVTQIAPGTRIRGADNFAALPSTIKGVKLRVNYTIDLGGNAVKDIWILTPDEEAQLWPRTPTEAQTWTYNPVTRIWIKP